MRRDDTSVTLEGPVIPERCETVTVIQRDGHIEVVHTYTETKIDRSKFKQKTFKEAVDELRDRGWR